MPTPPNIALVPPSFPPGYCFTTWQQFAIDLFTGAFGVLPASVGTGFNIGNAPPSDPADNLKPWFKTNPDQSLEGIYVFAFGTWVRPYPTPPGPTDFRAIWVGTLVDLYSYDHGDGTDPTVTPPTTITGSFWQQDTDFAARTLVGVGTLPLAGTVLSVGDTGGLDEVKLLTENLAPHTHQAHAADQTGDPNNVIWGSSPLGSTSQGVLYPGSGGLGGPNENPIRTTLRNTGGDLSITNPTEAVGHENMPPFKAVYVVKRTTRVHITI